MHSIYLLPAFICLAAFGVSAQNGIEPAFTACGSDRAYLLHPELRQAQEHNDHNAANWSIQYGGARTAAQALRTLPVVVHIVHNGGAENISDAQVQQGINHLNAAFNAGFGTGVNTELQFCLAQRDPQGQATNGITRDQSPLTQLDMDTEDLALKNLNRWAPSCYINIWVVAEISSASSGSGVAGYAYLPSAHGLAMDGIVMESTYFGSSQAKSSVLVHEMGHYLGLYHTFQGGCNNADCLLDGDRVCDTPPDQTTFSSCAPNANSCATDANDPSSNNPFSSDVADLGEDYMDYSSLSCYSLFTQGQSDRMNWHLTQIRSSLLQCLSCQTPCPAPVAATITNPAGNQTITVGSTLNFDGVAGNAGSLGWNIGSGAFFSTGLSASYTFNTPGVFHIKFNAFSDNPAQCLSVADSISVTVVCDAQAVFSVPPVLVNGLAATFSNSSTNATGYQWFIDNLPVSTSTDLNYTFPNTGAYQLCLRADNALCSGTLCTTVYVQQNGGPAAGCDNTFIQSLANAGGSRPGIFPHPGGDFFATGLRNDSTLIVRFDQGGATIWARTIKFGNSVYQIRDMFVDASGDLIGIAGFEATSVNQFESVMFRYNTTSHSFVWTRRITGVWYSHIHSLNTDDCVLTGTTSGDRTQLLRISKSTGATSIYSLLGEKGDYFSIAHNGVLYGTCRRYVTAFGDFRASVFAHDLNTGAFLWQNTIISEGNANSANETRMYPEKPVIDNDSLVVIASGDLQGFGVYTGGAVQLVVAKTSLTGNVAWTKQYIVDGYDRPVATAIVPTASGYYIVCNLYLPALNNFGFTTVIKTDKQGHVEWARRLGISGKNIARNIMERNGFLYMTMSSDSYAPNEYLLLKLDQQGNTNTDCDFIGAIQVETVHMANIQQVRNYTVSNVTYPPATVNASSSASSPVSTRYCNTPCVCPEIELAAGPDTTICSLQPVSLQATPGLDSYLWSPAGSLDDPAIPNPVATPSISTTYTLEATKWGPELVTNDDFSQGNTGFTSSYVFGGTGYGHYWVTDNPLLYNNQWNIPQDHSPGSDNMMMLFDGSIDGTLPLMWRQSVLVEPGKDYNFRFWVAMAYFASPPALEVRINGVLQGNFSPQGGNAWVGVWQPFSLDFNSGVANNLTIEIRNTVVAALGNDYALDDISLRTICKYSDSINVNVLGSNAPELDLGPDISRCTNAVYTFDAGAGFATYLWQDGSTDPSFTAFGPGTYWVAVSDSCGKLQTDTVQLSLAPAPDLDLGPDQSICSGDSVLLADNSGSIFSTFSWTPAGALSCALCASPWAKPGQSTVFYLAATTADGCTAFDSIGILVATSAASEQSVTLCAGEVYIFNGNSYTQSGTYVDTLSAPNGCDSVVTTQLDILAWPLLSSTVNFCPGDAVIIGGIAYTQPGTVVDTLPAVGGGCDTIAIYTLLWQTTAPSVIGIDCPEDVYIAVLPGTGSTTATYSLPVADSDCPCPGIALALTEGLPSGSLFPTGNTLVCYTASDSCGSTASCCFNVFVREESACDIKQIGCMKYELLTITADAGQNYTYRIRVTNNCPNKLIYTAIQLPDAVTAIEPADLSIFGAESGRQYAVRNPNYSPFYSVRFKSEADSISGGQSDILEYTLPAQSTPDYIHISSRLEPQIFYEAHLNTFYCSIGVTPPDDKPFAAGERQGGQPALHLFPNPTDGTLYLRLSGMQSGNSLVRIFDALGRETPFERLFADGSETLSLRLPETLSDGLYHLQFSGEKGEKYTASFLLIRD